MATAQYIAETLGLLALAFVFMLIAGLTFVRMVYPKPAQSEPEPIDQDKDWGSQ